MDHSNLKELISIDLDASDNLTEEMLFSFVNTYGSQLQGNDNLSKAFLRLTVCTIFCRPWPFWNASCDGLSVEYNNTEIKERKNFGNGYRRKDDIENPCRSFS